MSSILALLLMLPAPTLAAARSSDAHCASLKKQATESGRLDADTFMAQTVDCPKRTLTIRLTFRSNDARKAQEFLKLADKLDQNFCDGDARELQSLGYVYHVVLASTKLGKTIDRVLKCGPVSPRP